METSGAWQGANHCWLGLDMTKQVIIAQGFHSGTLGHRDATQLGTSRHLLPCQWQEWHSTLRFQPGLHQAMGNVRKFRRRYKKTELEIETRHKGPETKVWTCCKCQGWRYSKRTQKLAAAMPGQQDAVDMNKEAEYKQGLHHWWGWSSVYWSEGRHRYGNPLSIH